MTVLYTLSLTHDVAVSLSSKHLVQANGQMVIIFTKGKENSDKWPVLGHKIREQKEHLGSPSMI